MEFPYWFMGAACSFWPKVACSFWPKVACSFGQKFPVSSCFFAQKPAYFLAKSRLLSWPKTALTGLIKVRYGPTGLVKVRYGPTGLIR